MKKMKKFLAVTLAVILAFSSVSVLGSAYDFTVGQASGTGSDFSDPAESESDRNYGITTKFFRKSGSEWVPTDGIVKRGEDVKARVYFEANYISGAAQVLFAYDKDFYDFTELEEYTLNTRNPAVALFDKATIAAGGSAGAANKMKNRGLITEDQLDEYGFINVNITRSNKNDVMFGDIDFSQDGWEDKWALEFDLTVKEDADPDMKGETGDIFVFPALILDTVNQKGCVDFEVYDPEVDGDYEACVLWLTNAPLLQSDPQKVVNDVVFFANGGTFADGGDEFDTAGYVGDSVAAAEVFSYFDFAAPTKNDGTSFKYWAECDSEGKFDGEPKEISSVDIDFETKYYAAVWGETTPSVTLNANGGTFPSGSEEAVFTDEPGAPLDIGETVPTRPGYELKGWSTDPDATTGSALPEVIPESSETYYSVWEAKNFKLTYHVPTDVPNAVFEVYGNPEEHACDSNIIYAGAPAQAFIPDGYYFDSWKVYDDSTKTYSDVPATMPASDLDVYAHCTAKENTVNYVIDGKTAGSLQLDTDDEIPLTDPSFYEEGSPVFGDDTFDGWYTNAACTEKLPEGALVPADGITLYAKTSIPAEFDLAGGKLNGSEEKIVEYYAFNENIEDPGEPSKTGYEFTGWTPAIGTMDSKDGKKFVATWEKNSYDVTFKVDGKDVKTVPVEFEGALPTEEIPEDPDVPGKTFLGWDYDGDGEITAADVPPTSMPAEGITVNAIFDDDTYKINYNIAGESNPVHSDSYAYDEPVTAWNAPAKTGYDFDGWYSNPDGTGEKWTAPEKMPEGNISVYGKYVPKTYKVTYILDGETDKIQYVVFGEDIPSYKPEIDWTWADENGELPSAPDKMPASDLTVTGSASSFKKAVNYHIDGTAADPDHTDYVAVGSTVTPWTAPTETGKTFKGWFSDPEMTAEYTFGAMPENDVDVYGKYETSKNSITYYVDDVEYKTVPDVEYGTPITPEAAPEREGSNFSGWKWFDNNGNEIPAPATMPEYPVVAKGEFKEDEYTISYYTDSETTPSATETHVFDDPITEAAPATREGYTFNGWKWYDKDGQEITKPEKMPRQNLTVIAQWTVNNHSITYDLNGGNIDGDESPVVTNLNYGEPVPAQTDPANGELVFAGWKWFDGEGKEISKPDTMIDDDITAVAQWKVPGPDEFVLSYIVDGETFDAYTLPAGADIPDPGRKPTKFGAFFKGWKWYDNAGNEIEEPATMPEGDVKAVAQWIEVPVILPIVIPSIAVIIPAAAAAVAGGAALIPPAIGLIDKIIDKIKGEPSDPTDPDAPTDPADPDKPGKDDDNGGSSDDDNDIPDTGSAYGGIAAFAAISVAAATAYVYVSRKKDDED